MVPEKITEMAEMLVRLNLGLEACERIVRRAVIKEALERNRGNMCKTARQLRIHRNTMLRQVADLRIDVKHIRQVCVEPTRVQG